MNQHGIGLAATQQSAIYHSALDRDAGSDGCAHPAGRSQGYTGKEKIFENNWISKFLEYKLSVPPIADKVLLAENCPVWTKKTSLSAF